MLSFVYDLQFRPQTWLFLREAAGEKIFLCGVSDCVFVKIREILICEFVFFCRGQATLHVAMLRSVRQSVGIIIEM